MMTAAVINDCWPFFLLITICAVALWWLSVHHSPDRAWGRLSAVHHDQRGAVQSLSFVLTLPLFVMLMLLIVQLSQLTIARVVVEYAAYAAARSAIVWIPADLGDNLETPNRIGIPLQILGTVRDENGNDFTRYRISNPSPNKIPKIELAAAQALMSVCPSRDVGAVPTHPGQDSLTALQRAYQIFDPTSVNNVRIPMRIRNKLFYALVATEVNIEVRHKDTEPPLVWHDYAPYRDEFQANEIGWQDQVLVTVNHNFALLPGPARLLAKRTLAPGKNSDEVADRIQQTGSVFVYPLTATVRLSNEGEKHVLSYLHAFPN